ncbi:MAG: hypothetical protein KGL39_48180 [Patescibacteria group bacterium]|nr:hypothetical protein [Patescibacteria group bacterium]
MDMNDLMSQVNETIAQQLANKLMTLGELIDFLELQPQDYEVRFDFTDQGPGPLNSYRGYYDHLAFTGTRHPPMVSEVLADAKHALDNTFEGYKGGTYLMTRDTPLWYASDLGECHNTGIVKLTDEGGNIVMHTSYVAI